MGIEENEVGKENRLFASKRGGRLFRNNVGTATTNNGCFIRFGLCPGSTDNIGAMPITITPAMVGKRIAVFTAIEDKSPTAFKKKNNGKKANQEDFIAMVISLGGIGACVDRPELFDKAIVDFVRRMEVS